ncbi:MAG: bacterial Ig-like domain-containing protein [Ruminococcus sp.]|nr:bacterial Ig-like domain-containing protein [Ruminococcus sp.]
MKQHTTFCKRVLSLILVFMLTVSLLPSASLSVSAAENYMEFLGGDGSEKSPYLIANKTHFNNIRKYATANAHFKLVQDIKFNENDTWNSIDEFNGVLDGDYYSIINFGICINYNKYTITNSMFTKMSGTIKNINVFGEVEVSALICQYNYGYLSNCKTDGSVCNQYLEYAGAFAEKNYGTIINCINSASITLNYGGPAGIAGINYGIIKNCENYGNTWQFWYGYSAAGITSINYGSIIGCANKAQSTLCQLGLAGGIAGINYNYISRCYNNGKIYGGLQGSNCHAAFVAINEPSGLITDCYNTGDISSNTNLPSKGIFFAINYGIITNSYSAVIPESISECKNIFGYKNSGEVNNCYYLKPWSDFNDPGITVGTDTTVGCTEEEMKCKDTFKGFDFNKIWKFDSESDYSYPVFTDVDVTDVQLLYKPDNLIQTVEGVYPDISQFQFKVVYSDKTEAIINGSNIWLTELDINKIGLQEFYLSYQGVRLSEKISVRVNKKKLVHIEVKTLPNKLKYTQGQKINLSGGKLSLIYDNGTSQEIEMTEADCYYNKNLVGTVTVRMEYNGLNTYFDITVNAKKVYSAVLHGPSKLVYIQGEELILTDTYINVEYISDDGFYESIQVTKDMISGYNPDVVGIQTVYVTYLNKKLSFVVRVVESPDRVFESASIINVSEQPYVVTEGMYPDLSNIMLEVKYTDGYKKQITVTQSMLADFNPNTLGTQKVYLYYNDKKTSNYITIDVIEKQMTSIEVKRTPDKIEYVQGQSLDLTGGAITILYSNNTTETVEMKEATPYYNRTLIGYVTVRLNFKEFNTYIQIKVNKKSVSTMTLSKPEKTEYIAGEKLDLSGLYLDVVYVSNDNYGEKIEVTPEMISGYDPNKTGAQQVTVTYLNMQATFEVNVIANTIIGDIDCDGSLNINDATVLQRYIAELITLTPQSIAVADVNNDGNININDVTAIQTMLVNG